MGFLLQLIPHRRLVRQSSWARQRTRFAPHSLIGINQTCTCITLSSLSFFWRGGHLFDVVMVVVGWARPPYANGDERIIVDWGQSADIHSVISHPKVWANFFIIQNDSCLLVIFCSFLVCGCFGANVRCFWPVLVARWHLWPKSDVQFGGLVVHMTWMKL